MPEYQTKYEEVVHKWGDLYNLEHETPEYKARQTAFDYTDAQIIITHFKQFAEDEARNYDAKKTARDEFQKQGNQEKVDELNGELHEHESKLIKYEDIRERLTSQINRKIQRADQPAPVSAPQVIEKIIPCPCDVS